MTRFTHQMAATHDHWFEEPANSHAIPALMLWWRHFAKQHSVVVDAMEWMVCGLVAVSLLIAELIANA
jgi:hypothetical protein